MSGEANEKIVVSIPRPRVLVVDDDQSFLEGVRDYFSSHGYVVDTAPTPETAARLVQEGGPAKYHLVIADLNFGELSHTRGDQFLLQNRALFRDAAAAVISGEPDLTPERQQQLREAGIHFLQKSLGTVVRLNEIAGGAREKRASEIAAILAEQVTPRVKELTGSQPSVEFVPRAASPYGSKLTDLFKGVIIDWLRRRGNPDTPVIVYGNRIFSANDLVEEVQAETEVGIAHVRMLLSEFENFLGDGRDGEARDGDNDDEPEV
jgi:CheY-like chemotaxis protein